MLEAAAILQQLLATGLMCHIDVSLINSTACRSIQNTEPVPKQARKWSNLVVRFQRLCLIHGVVITDQTTWGLDLTIIICSHCLRLNMEGALDLTASPLVRRKEITEQNWALLSFLRSFIHLMRERARWPRPRPGEQTKMRICKHRWWEWGRMLHCRVVRNKWHIFNHFLSIITRELRFYYKKYPDIFLGMLLDIWAHFTNRTVILYRHNEKQYCHYHCTVSLYSLCHNPYNMQVHVQ